MKLPHKLQKKIAAREANDTLRTLKLPANLIDFSSNDYLGFSKNGHLLEEASQLLQKNGISSQGATGSRLLSGNHALYPIVEAAITRFHESETALIFNAGYDANIGFFQSVPQRGDVILYDEYIHASIRDGITMSNAKAYKFLHNNLDSLERLLEKQKLASPLLGGDTRTGEEVKQEDSILEREIYVVTESVFSMDGDSPDLMMMQALCEKYHAYLVVDEAHATGVIGSRGQGLVQTLGLQKRVFARVVTFGKAMGTHGAAILGSEALREYLINFARSLIYTTALPPHTLATIFVAYRHLSNDRMPHPAIGALQKNIQVFRSIAASLGIQSSFIDSTSAIQCIIIPGVERVKTLSRKLTQYGYNIQPILSPTVPEGQERLRFCLHSFNTEVEITNLLTTLATFIDLKQHHEG
ncbi:aminotransferase class I/II-fold pyridoxal phosphate-dependent enzyme [Dokdonia ponticola]|uniref:Aminotransferase class I/II-fold pyridoxal phosphate-dependent enzyme n=1 Tax=Dokdonia ponticola TaxID=2041041 RepID=A0ABV9HZ06_9FLAO